MDVPVRSLSVLHKSVIYINVASEYITTGAIYWPRKTYSYDVDGLNLRISWGCYCSNVCYSINLDYRCEFKSRSLQSVLDITLWLAAGRWFYFTNTTDTISLKIVESRVQHNNPLYFSGFHLTRFALSVRIVIYCCIVLSI